MMLEIPMRAASALVLAAVLLASPGAARAQSPGPDAVTRARALVEERQYAEARALLESHVRGHPNDAEAAHWLGRLLLLQDQADAAIPWLEKAAQLDGRNARYRLWLGNGYGQRAMNANPLQQARLARRAKAEFEAAVGLDPGELDARWGLMQFYLMAPGIMGGDRKKAREQADEIRRRNPYRGVHAMILVHSRDGDATAMNAELDRGIRLYPDSVMLRYALATTRERNGDVPGALDALEEVLRRDPSQTPALYQIGRLGAVSGERLPRAEEAMRAYLRHTPGPGSPSHANAQWRLGMVLERQGRLDDAKAAYLAALALDPAHKEAPAALRRLGG
jgi:tetratricopeptide (TPR) repeat protein